LINDTSKPRQNRNTVLVMPRNSSRRVPANTRETRSTLNLKATTANAIIKSSENDEKSPLHKLAPELMGMILEFALTSDEPVKISKRGRHQMPGILQVSRKLREMGLKMYYKNNHFRALITGRHPDGPMKWAVEIASDNMRHILSFTFDYRLTVFDYRKYFLRLSRTVRQNQGDPDKLKLMCENVRRQVEAWIRKFDDLLDHDLTKIRLRVDFRTQGIPHPLPRGRKWLRTYLSFRIATLVVMVEALTGSQSGVIATQHNHVSNAIRRGTALRSTHKCWELVFVKCQQCSDEQRLA
jgi:hypothetical protein